jgi:hypothetical protein
LKQFQPAMQFAADAVFALSEPGQVSAPVRGPDGWYIFKLAKITPPRSAVLLAEPPYADWIRDEFDRDRLASFLASLRSKSTIKLGPTVRRRSPVPRSRARRARGRTESGR